MRGEAPQGAAGRERRRKANGSAERFAEDEKEKKRRFTESERKEGRGERLGGTRGMERYI